MSIVALPVSYGSAKLVRTVSRRNHMLQKAVDDHDGSLEKLSWKFRENLVWISLTWSKISRKSHTGRLKNMSAPCCGSNKMRIISHSYLQIQLRRKWSHRKTVKKRPQFTMYLSIFFDRILLSVFIQKCYAFKIDHELVSAQFIFFLELVLPL